MVRLPHVYPSNAHWIACEGAFDLIEDMTRDILRRRVDCLKRSQFVQKCVVEKSQHSPGMFLHYAKIYGKTGFVQLRRFNYNVNSPIMAMEFLAFSAIIPKPVGSGETILDLDFVHNGLLRTYCSRGIRHYIDGPSMGEGISSERPEQPSDKCRRKLPAILL